MPMPFDRRGEEVAHGVDETSGQIAADRGRQHRRDLCGAGARHAEGAGVGQGHQHPEHDLLHPLARVEHQRAFSTTRGRASPRYITPFRASCALVAGPTGAQPVDRGLAGPASLSEMELVFVQKSGDVVVREKETVNRSARGEALASPTGGGGNRNHQEARTQLTPDAEEIDAHAYRPGDEMPSRLTTCESVAGDRARARTILFFLGGTPRTVPPSGALRRPGPSAACAG